MGNIWVHNGTTWKQGVPSVGRATGHVPGSMAYRRPTTTTWSLIWQRDNTPPPAPTITSGRVQGTRNKFTFTVTTPNAGQKKFVRVVVKVGINKWSTSPTANDGTFYSEVLNGEAWSDWFTSSLVADNTIESGEVATKEFPAAYQTNINLALNTDINVTAWVQDQNLNWSAAATHTVRTLKATDPPAGMQVFRTAIHPSSWDSWSNTGAAGGKYTWLYRRTPNGAVIGKEWTNQAYVPYYYNWQGGGGQWSTYICFGTYLREVMNTAYEVLSVKMPLFRRNTGSNTGGDIPAASGPARGVILRAWANNQANVPALATSAHFNAAGYWDIPTNFTYGETEIVNFPKAMWQRFLDGKGTESSITFHAQVGVSTNPSSADLYDVAYVLPGISESGYKAHRASMSGLVIVEWIGYNNPWPRHTPGTAGFYPLGWSNQGPYAW